MSGQSIMDRMTAAKHSLSGQGLAKVVCKATTEEVMGPKKKHLDYLIQCTNEPNVSIPQLADLLIERTQHANWTVVFKALITIHNLMNYGNERFTQYLASNNCTFNLSQFIDKTGVHGYDMSTYIRRYSKYLNEKAVSYRSMAFDFCKIRRGKDDGVLRKMNAEKLLKTLPCLQKHLDALVEFDCTPNELTNGVMNACFLLLFKDLIRLFACYNDGIINLLEKYFDMNKKQCKDGLECYKRFLVRMDKVGEFLKVAENEKESELNRVAKEDRLGLQKKTVSKNVGIDKGDIPDLAKAPSSLLDALEQHLASLEGKKGVSAKPAGFTSAVNAISGNSSINISEEEKKKILDEENQRLQMLKDRSQADLLFTDDNEEQKLKEKTPSAVPPPVSQQAASSTNPFATNASPTATNNLLGSPTSAQPTNASDDLLSLTGNPFVQNVQQVMAMSNAVNNMQPGGYPPAGGGWGQMAPPNQGGFTQEVDFSKAFQNNTASSQSAALTVNTSFGSLPPPIPPSPSEATDDAEKDLNLLDPLDPLAPTTQQYSSSAPASSTLDNLLSGTEFSSPAKQGPNQAMFGTSPAVTSSSLFGMPGGIMSSPVARRQVTSDPVGSASMFGMPTSISGNTGMMMSSPHATRRVTSEVIGSSAFNMPGDNGMGMSHGSTGLMGSPASSKMAMGTPASSGMAVGSPHTTRHAASEMDQQFSGLGVSDTALGRSSPAPEDGTGFDAFGEVLKPSSNVGPTQNAKTDKLLNKDLDSSLASLAGNLNINPAASVKKAQHEWQPKGEQKMTGGANFQFQGTSPASNTWTAQPMANTNTMAPTMMYQQPVGQPMTMMQQQPGMMMNRPMGMGMQPMMGMQPQPGAYGAPMMAQPRQATPQSMNDPFGAL